MFLRYFGRFRLRSVSVAVQNDWTEPEGHFRSFFAVLTQKYGLARQSQRLLDKLDWAIYQHRFRSFTEFCNL